MTITPTATEDQKTTRPTEQTRHAAPRARTLGEDAVPAPGHSMEGLPKDFRTINGWGADLDPKKRPAVPRELPTESKTLRGDVKHWQVPHVKIFMSNEMPGLTPTFGEAQPPRLLSGLIKEYAYQFGEATNRHWMMLMLSNRVDVLESAIISALKGKPDNIISEKGWPAILMNRGTKPSKDLLAVGAIVVGILGTALIVRKVLRND